MAGPGKEIPIVHKIEPMSMKMWNLTNSEIKNLWDLGYNTFYTLSGTSIKKLNEKGIYKNHFWNDPKILGEKSFAYLSETNSIQVLINPEKTIIPYSGGKSFEQQQELIKNNTAKLVDMGIYNAKFITLEASQVAELILKHLMEKNKYLLGNQGKHKYPFVNTTTTNHRNNRISVGCHSQELGFRIRSDNMNIKDPNIYALCVLVPA